MTDEFLRTFPYFRVNLPCSSMTPTRHKVGFRQDRNFDHYVAYASQNLEQLSFWLTKRIGFIQFHFNFSKPTQRDLKTNSNGITTAPSVENSITKHTNSF